MTAPEYIPIMPILKVERKENGLLMCSTNTFAVDNVHEDELKYVAYPYAGKSQQIQIHCEDPDLKLKVCRAFDEATDLHVYFHHELPALSNVFYNLATLALDTEGKIKSAESLKGFATGKPILFLGAGPSLTDNLDLVKEIIDNDKAIVIAGGSANRVLCHHAIFPHFGLVFDSKESEYDVVFSKLTESYLNNVPFITTTGLESSCFKLLQRAYLAHSAATPDLNGLFDLSLPTIAEGRSGVSTMILHVAQYMRCSKLYMLGVDLCYQDGNKYVDMPDAQDSKKDVFELGEFTTNIMWNREADYVAENVKDMCYEFINLSDKSLLKTRLGIGKFEEKPSSIGDVVDVGISLPVEKLSNILDNTLEHIKAFNREIQDNNFEYPFKDAPNARAIFYSYHVLQQLREIRTGDYNKYLMLAAINEQRAAVVRTLLRLGAWDYEDWGDEDAWYSLEEVYDEEWDELLEEVDPD